MQCINRNQKSLLVVLGHFEQDQPQNLTVSSHDSSDDDHDHLTL